MQETVEERVAREDLVLFVNAAFACTGQSEFYGSAPKQRVSIEFLHRYILVNYRRMYCLSIAVGINHFNRALVIINILSTGKETVETDRQEEGEILMAGLRSLPPQRAFRLMEVLKERKVNNRRTRAIIRGYVAGLTNLPFTALKYRRRFRSAARHAHLKLEAELGCLLFSSGEKTVFTTPLYESYRRARYSQKAVYELPYTIAEGLAQKHGIPRALFLERIAPKMTATERLRLQNRARKAGVSIDLHRVNLTALMLYVGSLSPDERKEQLPALQAALRGAVRRSVRSAPRMEGKVAAVLDRSYSSSGSTEKKRRPLAVAMAVSSILRENSSEYKAFWTPDLCEKDELLAFPSGQTNIANPLLDALEWGAKTVVIVSDGYENDAPGAVGRLVRGYRAGIGRGGEVSMIHLNPVFESELYEPRALSSQITTMGLRNAEDLFVQLSFARFADGSALLTELEDFMTARVAGFVQPEPKGKS